MLRYLLTCNPGLEDITVMEVLEEVPGTRIVEERRGRGRILIEAPIGVERNFFRMRSIHSASLLLAEGDVGFDRSALAKIERITKSSGIHRFIPRPGAFAVRSERIGEGHEYTSIDVARVVGKAVQEAYMEEYGFAAEVRLEAPNIALLAEVDNSIFRLGVYIIGERSGHRRGYRVYDHPAALKPTIAYALLRLAGVRDSSVILDPMCGGGTVVIEAAHLFEDARIICVDRSARHIEGAMMNAEAARVDNRIEFYVWDARKLHELLPGDSIDYVASNPPYGIRLGDPHSIRRLYGEFIPSLFSVMSPGGKAVFITTESHYMSRVARLAGFDLIHARKVRHGDLWVSLLVFQKPS